MARPVTLPVWPYFIVMDARMYAALAKGLQRGERLMDLPLSSTITVDDEGKVQVRAATSTGRVCSGLRS